MNDETEELFDLSNYTYEEWLKFCFDRPEDCDRGARTGDLEVKFDLARMLGYLTRLFKNPESVIKSYRPGQIENGLMYLFDPCYGIFMHFWDLEVPWDQFEAMISAMESLSRKLFALPEFERVSLRWWGQFLDDTPWDWITSRVSGEQFGDLTQEYELTERIAGVILDVLKRILDADSAAVQASALKGLACLRLENKATIIDEYLERSNIDGELKTMAQAARDRHGRLPPNNLDLLTYEEWVRFVFDHDVSDPEWHWEKDWDFIATLPSLLERSTRLLRNARELRQAYSSDQLEQGLWFLAGSGSDVVVHCVWDTSLPYENRKELVLAMEDLYADLFQLVPLESASFMWWELVFYDFFDPRASGPLMDLQRDRNDERRLQEVFFEVLCKVLALDSRACQESALHGLGHLWHPGREKVIDRFIEEHPEIDEELKKYALSCREGKMP